MPGLYSVLNAVKLIIFLKTSGAKGYRVVLPLTLSASLKAFDRSIRLCYASVKI